MSKRRLWRAVPVLALLVFIPLALGFPRQSADSPQPDVRQQLTDNLRRGRPVQALFQAERLAAETGWTPELLRTAGEIAYQLGDHARAAAYWEAIPADAMPLTLLRQLAGIHYEMQDWPKLAAALDRLLAAAPDDRWARFNRGWLLAVSQPEAAPPHLQAAGHDPLYHDMAFDLLSVIQTTRTHLPMQVGITLAQRGLWPEAEYAFNQAAAGDGPQAEALAYSALARDQQGKDGQTVMQHAVMLGPQNALVRFLQGLHLRLRHDLPGSLEAFQLAAALDPVNPAYAAELGTAYHLTDDVQQAESWFKRAVTLSGGDARFQQLLEAFYAQTLPK
ncbi:MAG: hypothetical protein HZC41_25245 [Chloroflexi bacterium]|nr:hypothetical protein [Chloroflexota bacterium]